MIENIDIAENSNNPQTVLMNGKLFFLSTAVSPRNCVLLSGKALPERIRFYLVWDEQINPYGIGILNPVSQLHLYTNKRVLFW